MNGQSATWNRTPGPGPRCWPSSSQGSWDPLNSLVFLEASRQHSGRLYLFAVCWSWYCKWKRKPLLKSCPYSNLTCFHTHFLPAHCGPGTPCLECSPPLKPPGLFLAQSQLRFSWKPCSADWVQFSFVFSLNHVLIFISLPIVTGLVCVIILSMLVSPTEL